MNIRGDFRVRLALQNRTHKVIYEMQLIYYLLTFGLIRIDLLIEIVF